MAGNFNGKSPARAYNNNVVEKNIISGVNLGDLGLGNFKLVIQIQQSLEKQWYK